MHTYRYEPLVRSAIIGKPTPPSDKGGSIVRAGDTFKVEPFEGLLDYVELVNRSVEGIEGRPALAMINQEREAPKKVVRRKSTPKKVSTSTRVKAVTRKPRKKAPKKEG